MAHLVSTWRTTWNVVYLVESCRGDDNIHDDELTFIAQETGASSDSAAETSASEASDDGMPQGPPMRRPRLKVEKSSTGG